MSAAGGSSEASQMPILLSLPHLPHMAVIAPTFVFSSRLHTRQCSAWVVFLEPHACVVLILYGPPFHPQPDAQQATRILSHLQEGSAQGPLGDAAPALCFHYKIGETMDEGLFFSFLLRFWWRMSDVEGLTSISPLHPGYYHP